MVHQSKSRLDLYRPNLVGTIHTAGGMEEARRIARILDAVEIRVDALKKVPTFDEMRKLPIPAILTVRRADEGGIGCLDDAERAAIYQKFIPVVAAIDVELRSASTLASVISQARDQGIATIMSFHDFQGTPSRTTLRSIIRRARRTGADVVKIATVAKSPSDAARLLELLEESSGGPLALMSMGAMGRALRLLLASQGSVLNYGWLHKPQVPGQWSAREFSRLLHRLL